MERKEEGPVSLRATASLGHCAHRLHLVICSLRDSLWRRWFAVAAPTLAIAPLVLLLGGCIGPPVLERQVLGYDQVAKTLNEQLLLLNIARVHHDETVHFTSTSSIAA